MDKQSWINAKLDDRDIKKDKIRKEQVVRINRRQWYHLFFHPPHSSTLPR